MAVNSNHNVLRFLHHQTESGSEIASELSSSQPVISHDVGLWQSCNLTKNTRTTDIKAAVSTVVSQLWHLYSRQATASVIVAAD